LLDLKRLKTWFDAVDWKRGVDYFESGAILDLFFDHEEDMWCAEVRGRSADAYQVIIPWPLTTYGEAACTCFLESGCKHIVATLLAIHHKIGLEKVSDAPAKTQPQRPAQVQKWLDELTQAAQGGAAAPKPSSDTPTLDIRIDLKVSAAQGLPELVAYGVHLNKNGEVSKRLPRRMTFGALYNPELRAQTPRETRQWIQEIELLHAESRGYYAANHAPDPRGLADLILAVAKAGKLHCDGVNTPALTLSETMDLALKWVLNQDGSQSAHLVGPEGQAVSVLETVPALWLSKTDRMIGLLGPEVPVKILKLLSRAPPLRAEDFNAVEVSLADLGVPEAFRPKAIKQRRIRGTTPQPQLILSGAKGRSAEARVWGRYAYGNSSGGLTVPALSLFFDYGGQIVPADRAETHAYVQAGELVILERDVQFEADLLADLLAEGVLGPDKLKSVRLVSARDPNTFFLPPPRRLSQFDAETALKAGGQHGRRRKADPNKVIMMLDRGTLTFQQVPIETLAFVEAGLPRRKAQNWNIQVHKSWPLKESTLWSDITARIKDTERGLKLDLMLDRQGARLDLAPLITEIFGLLPLDAAGNLPKNFDLEAALAGTSILMADGKKTCTSIEPRLLARIIRSLLDNVTNLEPFHPAEAGRYRDFADDLADSGITLEGDDSLLERAARLQGLNERIEASPPATFKGQLRPYQLVGYQWIKTLRETQFGGVLADDMGLGKTIEALAFLADLHLEQKNAMPSLVIAPTSVVGAWQRAAETFTPDLKVEVLHGLRRHGRLEVDDLAHIYVTTYALLHRDRAVLNARHWACVIADEAQAAKNPTSNAAKRLRELNADTRLAVTGTPVENNLKDLWSLFDWVVPGLLGNREKFTTLYRTPIERMGSESAQALLNVRTRPFILRRTKEEVETDLPLKTEIIETVALGEDQQVLYESVRLTMDSQVRKMIAAKGIVASHISILAALLQLRQVCCDPRLLKTVKGSPPPSAKFERLFEMLESLLAEGRRIIVFSQFVEMLKLIRAEVQARKWRYQWLDGATTHRDKVVDAFQSGKAELFLISLKAGGAGITLTAADTVILYDPWWNPQVERQAMDRVHRIGQDKPVFVYRLVSEGTVEEAIHQLQAKKRALADALFEGGATSGAAFTPEDIDLLLRPIENRRSKVN